MDFVTLNIKESKNETTITPNFLVMRTKDLMIRGGAFYAVWDEENGLWSTDIFRLRELIDARVRELAGERAEDESVKISYLANSVNGSWRRLQQYMRDMGDVYHTLDQTLVFANDPVRRSDYASKRLPYPLEPGDCSAWDELVGTLYSPKERQKIEWAIGAIVSGDGKHIQKFLTFFGPPGTGKSTILGIVERLFEGYTTSFDAKELGRANANFATEAFRTNPLVAIQHDGDLSTIEDNTRLNSIIAHETMTMNEKYKSSYSASLNAFLMLGTNKPVKISDSQSGLLRRLIDVEPTGVKIPAKKYDSLMTKIDFELGAITHHCLEVYRELGKNAYNNYRPTKMMVQTNPFYNFIEENLDFFARVDGVTLKQAYTMYKQYCEESGVQHPLSRQAVAKELDSYFDHFSDRQRTDSGERVRSYFHGFNTDKFLIPEDPEESLALVLDEYVSIFDELMEDAPAQYARPAEDGREIPRHKWANVETTLRDIDTREVHFIKVPENHIVIDFDLRDDEGNKSLELNLIRANEWPATYAEVSKSGNGVHLHYTYLGDTSVLANEIEPGIEVKVYRGNASLRRALSKCNDVPIAPISSGLPIKETNVNSNNSMTSEFGVRELIARNLKKEIHPGTKPSVDFIKKILDDAYAAGFPYDVTDLRGRIMAFAANSTNQSLTCIKTVQTMKFKSEAEIHASECTCVSCKEKTDERLVIFDLEVFQNLFVVCWKYQGSDEVVKMINPTSDEIGGLLNMRLVGFNNRQYDNHILYAAYMGYDNAALYDLSQRIISNDRNAMFREAYSLSYADIYDFSSKKQSLKKFEIELGLHHMELDIPWDSPVSDEKVPLVVDYCANDVVATEAVLEARRADLTAREILSEISGLKVNDTTQKHTAAIIFGRDRNPQASFVYTDLSTTFPGYTYDSGKSTYRGVEVGEGGRVQGKPGIYENVAVLDVASMHPTSIRELRMFGDYTDNFTALMDARLAIKHGEFDKARKMFDGRLKPYLEDEATAKDLSYALKIIINIVYGLTAAKFDNPFRDNRNKDNIAAKRGALFMVDLENYIEGTLGKTVVHTKTDSVKVPGATQQDIGLIMEFGRKYGYEFEHEATYDKFCLVNDAVYIAYKTDEDGEKIWDAVGAQFQHPVVFKSLFSGEQLTFDDYCETKAVSQGAMYLDFEHDRPMALASDSGMRFVGRVGRFLPVVKEAGGAVLWRIKDEKSFAVTGTKNYLWLESEMVWSKEGNDYINVLDHGYYETLLDDAVKTIEKYGNFDEFVK